MAVDLGREKKRASYLNALVYGRFKRTIKSPLSVDYGCDFGLKRKSFPSAKEHDAVILWKVPSFITKPVLHDDLRVVVLPNSGLNIERPPKHSAAGFFFSEGFDLSIDDLFDPVLNYLFDLMLKKPP